MPSALVSIWMGMKPVRNPAPKMPAKRMQGKMETQHTQHGRRTTVRTYHNGLGGAGAAFVCIWTLGQLVEPGQLALPQVDVALGVPVIPTT